MFSVCSPPERHRSHVPSPFPSLWFHVPSGDIHSLVPFRSREYPSFWFHVPSEGYPSLWSHVPSWGYSSFWSHVLSWGTPGSGPMSLPEGIPGTGSPGQDCGTLWPGLGKPPGTCHAAGGMHHGVSPGRNFLFF